MSDLSDSQNVSVEAFLTESDPSSPSVGPNSEPENSPVGRTRLLADIPPTTDRERELRSKFLNDPSTPKEQNLTLRYLTASQSGDKQTLRELRHQILARRTRRHPPADAVPGLDVPPLREHAWLDSLADAGVRVPSNFYDRLQESVTPNPPIIDLGDDNDSPNSMARGDDKEATYQRRTDVSASKAPMVEEVSRTEEENETGPGTGALWLPEDDCNGPLSVEIDEPWRRDALELHYPRVARNLYHMPDSYRLLVQAEGSTLNLFRHLHWLKKNGSSRLAGWWSIMTADKKMTVQPKMTSLKGWQDAFFLVRVPDDFPVRRHFTEPAPHMELLPLKPLTKEELVAYDYFASADYDTTYDDGKVVRTKEPSTWLPHTKYILGDRPLSALLLSPAYENGLDHLDLDALGVDSEHRPLTHLPAPPSSDYLTMHNSTNGRRGGNRHGPQNLRRRGRGASTSVRIPIVAATSNAPPSPAVPLRSSATRTVNRGAINRRRTKEPTVDDSAANKRQAVEEPGASAANEVVQVEDLDPNTSEGIQGEGGLDAGLGNAGGTSLLSRSTSSLREKLRELIATPSFLSNLSPGIFYRFREWIEKKEVPLSDAVAAAFAPQTVTPSKVYQPNWDVREDESLYSDIPEIGGILTYRILKGMQLPLDRPSGSLKTPAARLAHDQLVEAEEKVAPLEDEVLTLRDRAALLEEAEENVKALTKAVETANSEKEMTVLDASAAEARAFSLLSRPSLLSCAFRRRSLASDAWFCFSVVATEVVVVAAPSFLSLSSQFDPLPYLSLLDAALASPALPCRRQCYFCVVVVFVPVDTVDGGVAVVIDVSSPAQSLAPVAARAAKQLLVVVAPLVLSSLGDY
ncbi:hypothetical protein BVRB_2g039880 [Beta vulgaris subsp. vulgaris]|nr:hypothetical protein BVRB_2g039880 [Beta vulgaris subsp. vulgaris]